MEAEPLLAMGDDVALVAPVAPESEVCLAADVEAFLATLRREQVRFLDAISAARVELHSEPGQLAKAAALQARLTQRFLDAQRSILRGRAEADAKVARIAEDAETTDSLAILSNAAFESDGAEAERQLRSLLDDWWRAEGQLRGAQVDSCAPARGTVEPTTESVEPEEPADVLPGSLLAALDTIDHTGLETLLVSLLDALGNPTREHGPSRSSTAEASSVTSDPDPSAESDGTSGQDAFDSFWGAGSTRWTHRVARNWVVAHVLFPTVTVVAGLALVFAWTG